MMRPLIRHSRKAARPSVGRRQRRKNYDDSDEFDSVDFAPGDQQLQSAEQTSKAK
jgi:hypothetical protein